MRDLDHAAGAWVVELPSVLWGLRTTPNQSTGQTPFFMVYGAEAVFPCDLHHNAPRVDLYTEVEAEQARQDGIDLLEEERDGLNLVDCLSTEFAPIPCEERHEPSIP